MQEIQDLFIAGLNEIEGSSSTLAFELGSEHFISERDYEEVKILFNLARLSIENPSGKNAAGDILTSDLRKISTDELEKVLDATEKAINIPVITLKAIKGSDSKNISKILLSADDKYTDLFKTRSKKLKPASATSRIAGFIVDISLITLVAALLTFLSQLLIFPEVTLSPNELSLPGILLLNFSLSLLLLPTLLISLFGKTAGMKLTGLRIVNQKDKNPSFLEAIIRSAVFPLSLVSLSVISIQSGGKAFHDTMSGTRIVKN